QSSGAVSGSHVATVRGRLRRLARVYGAEPQFVLASATIANPGDLARELIGARATLSGDDGAPRAETAATRAHPGPSGRWGSGPRRCPTRRQASAQAPSARHRD